MIQETSNTNKEPTIPEIKEFLDHFGVKYDNTKIYLHDGHTSIIFNSIKFPWAIGHSIMEIAEYAAKKINLQLDYSQYRGI